MKKITILLLLLTIYKWSGAQNVGIGTATPDSSAMLEIKSTDKGLLLPRVNDTSSIKKPARGLLVYNNYDNTPWYYDGNRWQKTIPDAIMATEAIGMDSLWYKVQDTIAYTLHPYVQINTSLGLVPPQANLQLTGNLLVQPKTGYSTAAPTATQTYTMSNTPAQQSIPVTDSVFRVYDPGGTANYNSNMQGNISIQLSTQGAGLKISSVAADFGLSTGDTLWIAYEDFPTCRTDYAYFFTNTSVNPGDMVVSAPASDYVYLVFRSDGDGMVNKGFNFSLTRLYNLQPYKKIQSTGYALYFNSSIGAFGTGSAVNATGTHSVAMGFNATASGNTSFASGKETTASGNYSTAMGLNSIASGPYSAAIGYNNTATGTAGVSIGFSSKSSTNNAIAIGNYAKASGVYSVAIGNTTTASGISATSLGSNTTASGAASVAMGYAGIAGGNYSTATGKYTEASGYASTAMGDSSTASGDLAFASGFRAVAGGTYSTAIGSYLTASGNYSTAIGTSNTASGAYSTALGNFVNTNGYTGSFLIGDLSTISIMNGTSANNFRARFAGGYRFYTSSDYSTSCALSPGANAWSTSSDARLKENFATVNGEEFLKKIAGLSLVSWNYKKQDPAQYRHYGPMAQDFYAAFGKDKYGNIGNDTTINSADFDGVNMIAIQALEKRSTLQQKQIEQLNNIILQLSKELEKLKKN